jgi:D-alanyl-lipoteichoic acid acyltransferase DltB (MBOAT superfamily)
LRCWVISNTPTFFIDNINALTTSMGLPDLSFQSSVALPIGISFYIFHSLSYCIDVYRGGIRPTASWRDYLLYVAFFPQLVAGPIVRWTTMGEQIETPRPFLTDRFILGVALMIVGLFQKIVLADGIFAPVANAQFDQSTFDVGVSVWMGALAFTGQIFCDFAGYTTCAIGAASSAWISPSGQLPITLCRDRVLRFLAALAHFVIELVAGLSLYFSGR